MSRDFTDWKSGLYLSHSQPVTRVKKVVGSGKGVEKVGKPLDNTVYGVANPGLSVPAAKAAVVGKKKQEDVAMAKKFLPATTAVRMKANKTVEEKQALNKIDAYYREKAQRRLQQAAKKFVQKNK